VYKVDDHLLRHQQRVKREAILRELAKETGDPLSVIGIRL
jgi:hypothetical protein